METLDAMHIDYDLSDCYIDAGRLCGYRYVFAAAYRQMPEACQELLLEYAGGGEDRNLILGPSMPVENRRREECGLLDALYCRGNRIRLLREVTGQSLADCRFTAEYVVTDKRVELTVHTHPESGEQLLWLANVSGEDIACKIAFPGKRCFRAIWNCQDIEDAYASVTVAVAPYTVAVWKVVKPAK